MGKKFYVMMAVNTDIPRHIPLLRLMEMPV